jgi:ferrous iron transport protein B
VDLGDTLSAAVASIPANLSALGTTLLDPLGMGIDEYENLALAATEQDVATGTLGKLQQTFDGNLGAFAYLLFILLYMPCVATIGAIFKEIGAFWAGFSTIWSLAMAYSAAAICFQAGRIGVDPAAALKTGGAVIVLAGALFAALIRFGRGRAQPLIPVVNLDP